MLTNHQPPRMLKAKSNIKVILLLLGLMLIVLFSITQIYALMSNQKIEHQAYQTILHENNFEIRHYPEALMATVISKTNTYRGDANHNFRRLAGYIFGNNKTKETIGMTAPVHMQQTDSGSTMSFVMPSRYQKGNLPTPTDSTVTIHEVPPGYFAVLTFGGFAPESKIIQKINELNEQLQKRQLHARANPRYLGYNAPYELFGRHNEIIVEIDYNNQK